MKNNFKGETTQLKATIIGITGERNDGAVENLYLHVW